jgi:hypothetical protein
MHYTRVKRDEKGAIVKHKARLIAKGYVQQGVDFRRCLAPATFTVPFTPPQI